MYIDIKEIEFPNKISGITECIRYVQSVWGNNISRINIDITKRYLKDRRLKYRFVLPTKNPKIYLNYKVFIDKESADEFDRETLEHKKVMEDANIKVRQL